MNPSSNRVALLACVAAIAALVTFTACSPPPDTSDVVTDTNEASVDVPSIDVGPDAPSIDIGIDTPLDGRADGEATCGSGPACGAGQLCSYQPGCSAEPVRYCGDNTCGDAVAIDYCGCDGVTFVSGCLHPDRPYAHAGSCEDASTSD